MKKIILILLFIFALSEKNINAQTPVTDTLSYLQTIVNNKSNFIGHPFSRLNDSLQISIKYFWPNRRIVYNKSKEPSTHFSFYFPQNAVQIYLTYPCLVIYWQMPLNADQSDVLWENNNGGGWATSVATFYSTGIIADIKIRQ